jgi:hypothetical protein
MEESLYDQAERHQAERRQWQEERRAFLDTDVERLAKWDRSSRAGVNTLARWVVVRSIIELAILILLWIRL